MMSEKHYNNLTNYISNKGMKRDKKENFQNGKLEEVLLQSEICSLAHNIVVTDDNIQKWEDNTSSSALGTMPWGLVQKTDYWQSSKYNWWG
tara:strand:- start:579 stop:851 length:273 start_codon:yes stop_codon:yes gene_type:complete